ncbi:ExbD/TolR family protein [Arcobacter sp. FWKO B]|uniref:ExbD/TolR family protein n=1 Tax=Arcobacter sp. FWKO B TaxID=2593672 RepID=UPI0018A51943|nr:biopolymer transporter ExbD [Arcobacter sp. FWKO B]QOG11407.1 biopolymer transporter ExbD [Arcobacter sp. FWKO B]
MVKIKKFDSINVVPFIDIMLVLLVIVLTTASFVSQGIIPVELPDASSASEFDPKEELIITINKENEVFFGKEIIDINDISNKLSSYDKKASVFINCDKSVPFEKFVHILDIVKLYSFENVGIITNDNK